MLLWGEYYAQVGDEHSADNPVEPWRYCNSPADTVLAGI